MHERRRQRYERIAEFPFSSQRKMMSVLVRPRQGGERLLIVCKGRPTCCCSAARPRGSAWTWCRWATRSANALADVAELSDAALRTLSVAYRPLRPDEDDAPATRSSRSLIFVGTVGIIDPPRHAAARRSREAHRAGIRIVMITGDHPRTAARASRPISASSSRRRRALSQDPIDALTSRGWPKAVRSTSVYARGSIRRTRLRIVDALQADGMWSR